MKLVKIIFIFFSWNRTNMQILPEIGSILPMNLILLELVTHGRELSYAIVDPIYGQI